MTNQRIGGWLLFLAAVLLCAGIGAWDGAHRTGIYSEKLKNGSGVVISEQRVPANYWHTKVPQPSNSAGVTLLILGGAAGIGGGVFLSRRRPDNLRIRETL